MFSNTIREPRVGDVIFGTHETTLWEISRVQSSQPRPYNTQCPLHEITLVEIMNKYGKTPKRTITRTYDVHLVRPLDTNALMSKLKYINQMFRYNVLSIMNALAVMSSRDSSSAHALECARNLFAFAEQSEERIKEHIETQ